MVIEDDEYFLQNIKIIIFKFYNSLKKIIPCPICRNHFHKIMKEKDIYKCKTKTDLINWTIKNIIKLIKVYIKNNLVLKNQIINIKIIELKTIIKGLDIINL